MKWGAPQIIFGCGKIIWGDAFFIFRDALFIGGGGKMAGETPLFPVPSRETATARAVSGKADAKMKTARRVFRAVRVFRF
jgi:hypothetical protein